LEVSHVKIYVCHVSKFESFLLENVTCQNQRDSKVEDHPDFDT